MVADPKTQGPAKVIKILHIISGDLWAGAEAQVYGVLSCLKKNKETVPFCILFNEGILREKLSAIGVQTIVIHETRCTSYSLYNNLVKAIDSIKPDIIHVHRVKEHLFSKIYNVFGRHNIPLVRTVHGSRSASGKLPLKQYFKASLAVKADNFLIKNWAHAVIAVSKDLEKEFILSGVKGKICQIYNAIDIDGYTKSDARKDVRKRHGASDLFWIGTAARLVEVKNLPILIEAGKYLKQSEIPFKISIFGEGPLKSELLDLVKICDLDGKVELPGFEENIQPVIESLDVFVLPSRHEGLPMSLLEAMALKTPVVCSRVGGMAEVIENEVNGLLFDVNNSKELVDCIIKLQKNPAVALTLAENARRTIENDFSLSKTTGKLIDVYSDVIGQAAGR
jgi:L-malate glycosyltransferase